MPCCDVMSVSGLLIAKTSVKEEEDLGGFALKSFEGAWGLEKSANLYLYFASEVMIWLCSSSCVFRLWS